jgi:hypothetical protein
MTTTENKIPWLEAVQRAGNRLAARVGPDGCLGKDRKALASFTSFPSCKGPQTRSFRDHINCNYPLSPAHNICNRAHIGLQPVRPSTLYDQLARHNIHARRHAA